MKSVSKSSVILFISIILLIGLSGIFLFRIDLTSDKRFTVSRQTRELMKSVSQPVKVTVYLTGDLNPGFMRLKKSTTDMLTELNIYSKGKITIELKTPVESSTDNKKEIEYSELEKRGMTATSVHDKDKEGKFIQKIIFPWVELSCNGKIIPVNLLKNNPGLSGDENLNISLENLEFELTDAFYRLTKTKIEKIAFLEGHGELNETETYEASKSLSRYFQIDRGVIGTDAGVLNDYKVVIIAKPTNPFSEKDKYVLDQYLMNGGSLLWLIDGVRISEKSLTEIGETPAIPYDLNLEDMLFRYGVRINPSLVQDVQCALMPVNVAPTGQKPQFEPIPWVFSPLLLTSGSHPVSRNISPVQARFASSIDLVGNDKNTVKKLLLASSGQSHLLPAPGKISMTDLPDVKDRNYFSVSHIPVGVSIEGVFESVFANRIPPVEIVNPAPVKKTSFVTRQIVIADGDIIRNDIQLSGDSIRTLPPGFDRYTSQQFGNNDLIVNSILFLTDNNNRIALRSRTLPLRLLKKNTSTSELTRLKLINVVLPLLLLLLGGVVYHWIRKRRYR